MKNLNRVFKRTCITIAFSLVLGSTGMAFQSFVDSGEILPQGQFELTAAGQAAFSDFEGFNMATRLSRSFSPDFEGQIELGFGAFEFQTTALLKYTAFPDNENQPAIGAKLGASYSRFEGISIYAFHLIPFVSKRFITEYGDFVPYGAFNLSFQSVEETTNLPLQLQLGTGWKPKDYKHIHFYGELGMNLSKAYNYISLGMSIDFDSFSNIQFN